MKWFTKSTTTGQLKDVKSTDKTATMVQTQKNRAALVYGALFKIFRDRVQFVIAGEHG